MEQRAVWAVGETLRLSDRDYRVEAVVGMGSNAIVYQVAYQDGLSPHAHTALLKELYPAIAGVSRAGGVLCVSPEAQSAFALHRRSYLRGNDAHLRQLQSQAGRVSGNIDSFAARGTLYTLLDYHAQQTLAALLDTAPRAPAEVCMRRLYAVLDALAPFHEASMLHLDVSADNLLMLPPLHGYEADQQPMLLIDYNGVWDQGDTAGPSLSSKSGYTAPEARLMAVRSLGFATDLFAVCAVFFEMLTGRRLTDSECGGQFHARMSAAVEAACEGLPQTARLMAVRILRKGLQPLPSRRYQSIAELRSALCELMDRIHGKGVTHAALWEAARLSLADDAPPASPIPLTVTMDGQTGPADGDWLAAATRPLLLTGAGGSGKTTLFKALHRRFAQRYDPAAPICYYVPLFRWQGRMPFLLRCLAEGLTPLDDADTQADVHAALLRLLKGPLPGGGPLLLLLLDGLNEAGARPDALYREIAELSALAGVRILATSRAQADLRRLPDGFGLATVDPLAEGDVMQYLTRAGLSATTSPAVRAMLTCPLLLTYYRDTCEAWRQSGQSLAAADPDLGTPEALLRAYIDGQVTRFEALHRGSEVDCLRARYAAEHLLPKLAAAMRGGPALPQAQAAAVVARDYRALRSRAFGKAFPEYMGRSRLLLTDVRSAAEWYDVALRESLAQRLGLLTLERGGEVALRHDSFRPPLRQAARRLGGRMAGQRARQAAVWLLCAALAMGAFFGTRALLDPSMTRAEQAYVLDLQNAEGSAMLAVSEIEKAQAGVRAALAGGSSPPRIQALLPSFTLTLDLAAVPWQKAGLTRAAWETVLRAPEEASRLYLGALLVLADAFGGGHTDDYRTQRLAAYDAFSDAHRTYYLLTLYAAFAQSTDEARSEFYQIMKNSANALRDAFVQTAQPQGDAAAIQAQCDTARAALEQTLFYQLAVAEADRWPDTQTMADTLSQKMP